MHFWIDKRSQTCGFSGRHRVPTSISASCGHQRRRRRRSRGKLMVTPVHRFQPIESVAVAQHGGRRNRQLHSYYPSSYPASGVAAAQRHSGAHSAELDSSVYLDIPLDSHAEAVVHRQQRDLVPVGRLKCGMWASFALATVFVAGAKFYFDHQGSGLEILVFCALLAVFFLAGCTVSLCRAKVTRDLLTATAAATQGPSAPAASGTQSSSELEAVITEVALSTLTPAATAPPPPPPPEMPPPPYHIAILLPQQTPSETDEAPPPSYEKAVS